MEPHEPASLAEMEQKRETLNEEDHKGVAEAGEEVDVVAQMAELKVREIKQPRSSKSKPPQHVVPNVAFTFKHPIWSRVPEVDKAATVPALQANDMQQLLQTVPGSKRPKHISSEFAFDLLTHVEELAFESSTDKDEEVDVATKMAGLRVDDKKLPPKPVPDRPKHVVPSAAFTFTSKIRNPNLRPVLALKQRKENGPPTTTFSFTDLPWSGGSGSTSGVEPGATRPTDAQQAAGTLNAGVLDKTGPITAHDSQTTASADNEARARKFAAILFTFATARILGENPSDFMFTIYDFTDPPRESLKYLPGEFWQVLDQCCEANAASKILETELHSIELERREKHYKHMDEYLERMDEYLERKISRQEQILERSSRKPEEDATDVADQPISWPEEVSNEYPFQAALPGILRAGVLEPLIEKARSECSKHEAKLNIIVWDLMVQRGLIPASVIAKVS